MAESSHSPEQKDNRPFRAATIFSANSMTQANMASTTDDDDLMQFLDSLDGPDQNGLDSQGGHSRERTTSGSGSGAGSNLHSSSDSSKPQDEQSVLDFLDEISQITSSSTSTSPSAPTLAGRPATRDPNAVPSSKYLHQQQQQQQQADAKSSWLGSLWSTASVAVKTTQTAVQSSVKATIESQAGKSLEERVKGFVNAENIGKIGMNPRGNDLKSLTLSSMTTVLDVIAPPIAEHEVVEIWVAHDMVGYVGLEGLVYRAFSKVMEQTEGGDVVVHPGTGTPSDEVAPEDRQLNACEGYDQAVKLAKANLEHLIKTHYDAGKQHTGARNPNTLATTCPIFMAIQPCRVPRHGWTVKNDGAKALERDVFISFVIVLQDPTHNLEFESCSQSMPAHWLLIPFEESEWVEDRMVDCIRLAVGVIAQDYVWTRMKGDEILKLQIAEANAMAEAESQGLQTVANTSSGSKSP